jgi:peptide/nickel transport system permease protein
MPRLREVFMAIYILKRLGVMLAVLTVTSIIAFLLLHLTGDPAATMAGDGASPEDVRVIRETYGFNRPLPIQYLEWVRGIFAGDFGRSYYLRRDVAELLPERLAVTATLGVSALTFALVLSITLGVAAALRPNTIIDRFALWLAVAGQAMPSFLVAIGLMYIFGVWLRVLPISGGDTWQHYILPVVALGYYATPSIMRLTRSGMMEALQSDHVRTARAYGLSRWRVVLRHALRHAIAPIVSIAAVEMGFMLGGSIIIESVFSLKGIGYLAWESIQRADIQVIQAILLVIAAAYAILTLVADLVNAALDPRIRVS